MVCNTELHDAILWSSNLRTELAALCNTEFLPQTWSLGNFLTAAGARKVKTTKVTLPRYKYSYLGKFPGALLDLIFFLFISVFFQTRFNSSVWLFSPKAQTLQIRKCKHFFVILKLLCKTVYTSEKNWSWCFCCSVTWWWWHSVMRAKYHCTWDEKGLLTVSWWFKPCWNFQTLLRCWLGIRIEFAHLLWGSELIAVYILGGKPIQILELYKGKYATGRKWLWHTDRLQ